MTTRTIVNVTDYSEDRSLKIKETIWKKKKETFGTL